MANPKYRVSGAIFENQRATGPAFSGFVEIDGVKTYIALWRKTSGAGNEYFQVSEDKKEQKQGGGGAGPRPMRPQPQRPAPQRPVPPKNNWPDDDDGDTIPF